MQFLRQSTASQSVPIGAFVDDTDGKTPETALTIANTDIKLIKNGGASVNKNSGGATHRINGQYGITLDATDSNTVGRLRVSIKVAGGLSVWEDFVVLEEAVFDLWFAAAATGDVKLQSGTHTGAVIPTVSVLTGHTPQTGDSFPRIGAGGAALGDLGGMSTAMKAEVKVEADQALIDYNGPTNAEMNARTLLAADYFDPAADTVAVVTTLTNKTGFSLAATGLDLITSTATGAVQLAKAVWDRVVSKANHNIGQSAGKVLRQGGDIVQIDGAVSDVSPSVSNFDTSLTQVDGYFDDAVLIFSNGSANAGIGRPVVAYLNVSGNMTFLAPDDWPVVPVNGDDFVIYATHVHPISQIQESIVTGGPIDTTAGAVDVVSTVTDKAGYELSPTGLDLIVSTAIGMVEIAKAIWDRVLTGATHNIPTSAGRRLRGLQDFGNYLGVVSIDTINGTPGVVIDENGTQEAPVLTLADAITINATVNYNAFLMSPASSIVLAQAFNAMVFSGKDGWTLALGGQNIANSTFNSASVSGVGIGVGTQHFHECIMGAVTLPASTHVGEGSTIIGNQTLPVGDIFYVDSHSGIAGTGAPIFDFGAAAGDTSLNIRNYSGGVDLRNMGHLGTDIASIEGNGQLKINVNCISGTVVLRGNWHVEDNSGGAVTIIRDDTAQSVIEIEIDTDTTIPAQIAALNDITVAEIFAGADVDGFTFEETLKLILASAAAKLSGAATTTIVIRAADDSKDRITATVDADGNRSAVILDGTG